jgi:hypothetical protein
MKQSAIDRFTNNIEKLLNGEKIDLYQSRIDSSFEYIAAEILTDQLQDGVWFDGTGDLSFEIKDENIIEFSGNMWIALNQEKFWQEPFFARVEDTRKEKKEMNIFVRIGDKEGENDLFKIVWKYKNT